jgi:hypothetical protein
MWISLGKKQDETCSVQYVHSRLITSTLRGCEIVAAKNQRLDLSPFALHFDCDPVRGRRPQSKPDKAMMGAKWGQQQSRKKGTWLDESEIRPILQLLTYLESSNMICEQMFVCTGNISQPKFCGQLNCFTIRYVSFLVWTISICYINTFGSRSRRYRPGRSPVQNFDQIHWRGSCWAMKSAYATSHVGSWNKEIALG